MPKFKDAEGREWVPKVTGYTLTMFEEQTGKSLFDPKSLDEIRSGKSLSKIMRLAYLACEWQTVKEPFNVSFKEFTSAFQHQDQLTEMATAVGQALTAFFQSRAPEASAAKK